MNDVPIPTFEHAIQSTHGAASEYLYRERVVEQFEGETVWTGTVLVFRLLDYPRAYLCYAWEVDGRVTAVLHTGPVNSPLAAVRASILADVDEEPEAAG